MQQQFPVKSYLQIRADYKLHRIQYGDIQLIESLDDYVQIYLAGKRKIVARSSLKKLLEDLPESLFVRVHRSYIVPLDKVTSVDKNGMEVAGFQVPLGEVYKADFLKRI